MFTTIIAAVIVLLIIKFMERGQDRGVDDWVSAVFVVIPALLIFVLALAIGFLGWPIWLVLPLTSLYFVVPTLMSRLQFELPWGRSCAYGGIVLLVVLVVDIAFSFAMDALAG